MEGFSKLTTDEKQQIVAGSWISVIGNIGKVISVIDSSISIISHVTGLFRATNTIKGEIKTKGTAYKWDNTKEVHIQDTPVYFTY